MKDGRADDFVRAWGTLAERTKVDFPNATATLLRDRDQPNRFISFGPWDSLEQVEHWRDSAAFRDSVGEIRATLESFIQ